LLPQGGGTYSYSPDGEFTFLTRSLYPTGVSGNGLVVVGGARTAMRWSLQDGAQSLGDLPGGETWGYASDASYDGSVIVGGSRSGNSNPVYEYEGFRWTLATGMVGIGALPAEQGVQFWSHPTAVSADGSIIVGESIVSATPSRTAAFIWRDDGRGMRKLRDVLIEEYGLGPQLAGWDLRHANDISPDGRFIVGNAVNAAGAWVGFLVRLDPPRCVADFNNDHFVNSQDFFDFLTAFFITPTCPQPCPNPELGCPADFNHDCIVNSNDFFDFLTAFFAGCG